MTVLLLEIAGLFAVDDWAPRHAAVALIAAVLVVVWARDELRQDEPSR